MSKPVGLTHILTELSSLDDLGVLLKRSARLKYTCISASKKYLALGSNTGGIYVFSRDTLKYQQVVFADSNSSPVTGIRLSPTNQHIAAAVSTGHVNVFELNIECRAKPERVRQSFDHTGRTVTAMTWDVTGQKLFVGDNSGKLSIIYVPNKKSKTLFTMPSEVISYLDTSIFQMDWWDTRLLVSTLTNCYLFDTNRHNYSSIGSKKRDGEFGACIFLEPSSLCPVIYCARPGSRIWEVDFEGKVLNTHQFKQLLGIPPVPVLNIMSDTYSPSEIEVQTGQSVSFNKMIPLGSLILTWSNKGLYLFDPINVKVIVWTDSYIGIRDIALYGNDAYLFLEDSSIHRLTLLSIYPLFQLLASRARWSLMSCLLLSSDQINMHATIVKRVRKDLFDNIINGLRESGKLELIDKLYGMMDDVSESSINSVSLGDDFMGVTASEEIMVMGHTTLPSGMVVVSEGFSVNPSLNWNAGRDYDVAMEEVDKEMGDMLESESGTSSLLEGSRADLNGDDDEYENNDAVEENRCDSVNGEKDVVMIRGEEEKENDVNELLERNEVEGVDASRKVTGGSGFEEEFNCDMKGQNLSLENDKEDNCEVRNSVMDNGETLLSVDDVSDGKDSVKEGEMCGEETCNEIRENVMQHSEDLDAVRDVLHLGNGNEHNGQDVEKVYKETEDFSLSLSGGIENGVNENSHSGSQLPSNPVSDHVLDAFNDTEVPAIHGKLIDNGLRHENGDERNELLEESSEIINSDGVDNVSDEFRHHQPLTASLSLGVENGCDKENKGMDNRVHEHTGINESRTEMTGHQETHIGNGGLESNGEKGALLGQHVFDGNNQQSDIITGQDSTTQQADKLNMSQKEINTNVKATGSQKKFSNVHFRKEDTDVIAKAVRRPKKKKKKANTLDHPVKDVVESQTENISRSASWSDLAQTSLYQHSKENDGDTISISTISSIGEDEMEAHDERATFTLSSSSFDGGETSSSEMMMRRGTRKHAYDTMSLTDDPELETLRRHSIQSSVYYEEKSLQHSREQVIPPLIDRLAAGKGGDRRGPLAPKTTVTTTATSTTVNKDALTSSLSSLTDSGEFSARMSQLPSSLSAMKDGLSLKLKNQTRHFIKSFKEKNPLLVKSPSSPMLHLSQTMRKTPVVKDSSSLPPNQSEESIRPDISATGETRKLSEEDRERLSLEEAAGSVVKEELESLYKKAVHIQSAVKTSNLVMQPVVFKSILNAWSRELNATMYKFLVELHRRKEKQNEKGMREESEKEKIEEGVQGEKEGEDDKRIKENFVSKEITGYSIDGKVDCDTVQYNPQFVDSFQTDDSSRGQNSTTITSSNISQNTTGNIKSQEDKDTSASSSGSNYSSHHQNHHCNHLHDPLVTKDSSVLRVDQILNVNDPFHLTPTQHQAFHDLCTLCFLCGATGDILKAFQLSEHRSYHHLVPIIESYLPQHLQSTFFSTLKNENCTDDFLSSSIQKTLFEESKDNNGTSACPCHYICRHRRMSHESIEKSSLSLNNILSLCPLQHRKQHKDFSDDSRGIIQGDVEGDEELRGERNDAVKEGDKSLTSCQIEDLELSIFLRVFFFIMDYSLVKQQMNRWRCSRFLTWVSMITCCHEKGKMDIVSSLLSDRQTNGAIDYLRSGILMHPSALIGHLHRLFQYTPGKTAEFCSEVQASITVQEVVAMCVLSDKSPTEPLLRYVRKYVIDLPSFHRPMEFGKLCDVLEVRLLLLGALLPFSGGGGDERKEMGAKKDGQSLTTSVISVLPPDWLDQILSRVSSLEEENLVLHLCLTARRWKPCIRLMSKGDNQKPLMDLLVAVGDMDLIGENGYIPQSTEEWRMLLSCFLHAQNARNMETQTMDDKKSTRHSGTNTQENYSTAMEVENSSENKNDDHIDTKSLEARHEENKEEETGENCNKNFATGQNDSESSCTSNNITKQEIDGLLLPVPSTPMTWESLVKLLVLHLGGAAAVEMMCDHLCGVSTLSNGNGVSLSLDQQVPLTSSLLRTCLSDFSIEADQRQVCHEMLERLSVHMWAKKPGFLPPSVGHVIGVEAKSKDGGSKVLEEDLACDRQINLLQSTSSKVLMSENFGAHWGQEIDVKQTCQTCQMPLRLIVSHDLLGVVLFPCGDAFHKKCCPGSSCPILH